MSATTTTRRPKAVRNAVSAAAPARTDTAVGAKSRGRWFNVIALIVLIVFAVLWLLPSLFALKTALTENSTSALGAGPIISSFSPTLHSFASLFGAGDIWNWYIASGITSVITSVLTVFLASRAAVALPRRQFRRRNVVFLLIILGLMIPTQVLVVPIFQELGALNLLNAYWGV